VILAVEEGKGKCYNTLRYAIKQTIMVSIDCSECSMENSRLKTFCSLFANAMLTKQSNDCQFSLTIYSTNLTTSSLASSHRHSLPSGILQSHIRRQVVEHLFHILHQLASLDPHLFDILLWSVSLVT
jgi:hypothetical protein